MTPEFAIASLPALDHALTERIAEVRDEGQRIIEQWYALGHIGGQRSDHAAAMLGVLRPLLREVARFASAAEQQITKMQADPFGRTEAA